VGFGLVGRAALVGNERSKPPNPAVVVRLQAPLDPPVKLATPHPKLPFDLRKRPGPVEPRFDRGNAAFQRRPCPRRWCSAKTWLRLSDYALRDVVTYPISCQCVNQSCRLAEFLVLAEHRAFTPGQGLRTGRMRTARLSLTASPAKAMARSCVSLRPYGSAHSGLASARIPVSDHGVPIADGPKTTFSSFSYRILRF